jgi:hypothetical protein
METNPARAPASVLPTLTLVLATAMLGACVTPIPLEEEAPDISYRVATPIVLSVVDQRESLAEGKPPTFIGRAHGAFGIPTDMQVYPWFVSDKTKKDQTLAQAIEERIVVGLNDEGWHLASATIAAVPTAEQARALLESQGAQRLMVLSITQWFASLNLSWVTAFNFDWGYRVDVFDAQGATITSFADSGRDVVDAQADQSPQNMLKLAFRDRVIKILERSELRTALQP